MLGGVEAGLPRHLGEARRAPPSPSPVKGRAPSGWDAPPSAASSSSAAPTLAPPSVPRRKKVGAPEDDLGDLDLDLDLEEGEVEATAPLPSTLSLDPNP
jgi:hypothetical protein